MTDDNPTQTAKPTIAELEAILEAPEGRFVVQIKPDGSIHAVERPLVHPLEVLSVTDDAPPQTAPAAPQKPRERLVCSWCGDVCDPGLGQFSDTHGNQLCETCWDGAGE